LKNQAKPKRWVELAIRSADHLLLNEALPAFLQEKGFSGLWIDEEEKTPYRAVLRAYFLEEDWEPGVEGQLDLHLKELSRIFPAAFEGGVISKNVIEEEDWVSRWLPFFEPLKIGSVWIRSSQTAIRLGEDEQEIVMDPGQAFGTGHHESTQLCMESILRLRPLLEDDALVLDLGTGTGILAMFAAKVGLRNILALDTDPVAVETAQGNLSANGVKAFVEINTQPLEFIAQRFALILANLSTSILEELCEELKRHMVMGGWLVVSGLLTGDTDVVVKSFSSRGLEVIHQKNKNEWACLVFRRPTPISA
jgi:ribosomal protein L11 methyltransferase